MSLFLFELLKIKFENFIKSNKPSNGILNSICLHEFYIVNNEKQKHDLILEAVKKISQDFGIELLIEEKKIIQLIISNCANKIKLKEIIIILNLIVKNIFDFLSSRKFFIKSSRLLDYLAELFIPKLNISDDFKILAIDPIQGRSLPFLSSLSKNGIEVFFT